MQGFFSTLKCQRSRCGLWVFYLDSFLFSGRFGINFPSIYNVSFFPFFFFFLRLRGWEDKRGADIQLYREFQLLFLFVDFVFCFEWPQVKRFTTVETYKEIQLFEIIQNYSRPLGVSENMLYRQLSMYRVTLEYI